MSATDSQLIEQGLMTAKTVASAFGVPAYKIGVGDPPSYNNIEALSSGYYEDCLQRHIEEIEKCLDDGLELKGDLGTEFDLTDLLRMDTSTKVKAAADAIGSGAMAPNEARFRYFDLGPVEGGDSPMVQQQYYSLEALRKRDNVSAPPPAPSLPPSADNETLDESAVKNYSFAALARELLIDDEALHGVRTREASNGVSQV